jgi:tetratricopeptide (TPR) repeat protein
MKNTKDLAKEFLQKAYKLQMKGNYEDAVANYKKSLEIYPTAEAYTFLGWTYSFMGNLDQAIEECKNAIAIDPELGNPYNDIGAYLIKQGKYDEAVTWLDLAINSKRYDGFHLAHFNLGRVLEYKGLWFEALDEYRRSADKAPDFVIAKQHFNRLQGMLN